MKRMLGALLLLCLLCPTASATRLETEAKAVLLMERETGSVLYEENAHTPLEPASVTKVMTMLLIMEAIDAGQVSREDSVTVSKAAAGMGGSQVFLKEGETMPVDDMLKAIAVASGNDASVAMAEHLAGTEALFVEQMNAKASELGMENTTFKNCTGLPAEGHLTTAYDIALMSQALLKEHPAIRAYTGIWMDTLRDGAFQLANTNRLIYDYDGATGLKTGSSDTALYCVSASAEQDGMELIAVVLGAPGSAARFDAAKVLLSYGFSTYALVPLIPDTAIPPIPVALGEAGSIQPVLAHERYYLTTKQEMPDLRTAVTVEESLTAPVLPGQKVGELSIYLGEELKERVPIVAAEGTEKLSLWSIYQSLFRQMLQI